MGHSKVGDSGEIQPVATGVAVAEGGATTPVSASPTGRFGRAVERFNRRALRFTRPGPRWFVASIKLGFIMKAAAVVVGVAVLAIQSAFGYDTKEPSHPGDSIPELVFLALVLAPLIETALIWLVHVLTRRWFGLTGFVLASTVLAYADHVSTTSVPIAVALVFSVMSYQYVSFRDAMGAGRAFAGVAVSHAVFNGVATSIVAIESVSGGSIL